MCLSVGKIARRPKILERCGQRGGKQEIGSEGNESQVVQGLTVLWGLGLLL